MNGGNLLSRNGKILNAHIRSVQLLRIGDHGRRDLLAVTIHLGQCRHRQALTQMSCRTAAFRCRVNRKLPPVHP